MVFLVRFFFLFLLDCLVFLCFIVGPIIAIVMAIKAKSFTTFLMGIVALIKKYGKYVLRFLWSVIKFAFLPAIVLYRFFNYLSKKCNYKVEKYKERTDIRVRSLFWFNSEKLLMNQFRMDTSLGATPFS